MSRYARAVDANQRADNAALEAMGYSVANTSRLGKGFPDAVVAGYGITVLVEWKVNEKAELTDDEQAFAMKWQGRLIVATTAKQVDDFMVRHGVRNSRVG